ncbi:uncharacterized protein PG986_004005 [Apiospora aurea]|uniref:WW domain-containing protein n=1 Tax=Apiospora aurea TaxID=335848 RepID=A0ABR1QLD4_9PEZI
MSALPEGWEWDYDGTRWLYRYKATGLVQYHFPKPGDEFPEYVGLGFGSFDMEPEERLASEMQTKRRDTQNGTPSGAVSNSSQRKKKPPAEIDEIGATGYFDPEGFMYLGPGGYADTLTSSEEEHANTPTVMENTSAGNHGSSNTTQAGHDPLPLASQPSGGLNDTSGPGSTISACIAPPQFIAELASQDTQKCADELAPIELDASQSSIGTALAELSSEGPDCPPAEKSPTSANANYHSSPPAPVQPTGAYPLVSASFSFRPLEDKDHPSGQSPSASSVKSSMTTQHISTTASSPENAPFQAWKPGVKPGAEESVQPKRSSLVPSGSSLMEFQNRELGNLDQRRYSFPAKVPTPAINRHPTVLTPTTGPRSSSRERPYSTPGIRHSPIPTALRPATRSESPLSQSQNESVPPGSKHDIIPLRDADLTHCPSVLKPAKSRQSRPHASTVSGNLTAAPGLKPAAHSPPPPKSGELHHTSTHEHHDSGEPLRMPDFPDYDDDDRPHLHRVNTMPDQLPSQSSVAPSKASGLGPGFYVFHEIKPGKDPLESEEPQTVEAQELAATERPAELSSDPAVSIDTSPTQAAPEHTQQAQATHEHGNSSEHATTQQSPSQTNSSDAASSQPQPSSPSSHANETVNGDTQPAPLKPPKPVATTDGPQTSATSQASDLLSSASGSAVKPNQSSQNNHEGDPATSNEDTIGNGPLPRPTAAYSISSPAPRPHKPANSGSDESDTGAQYQTMTGSNVPLHTQGDGPGSQVQGSVSFHSTAPQGQGTVQGTQHCKPPSKPPSQPKPQQVHTPHSSTMNTERPPVSHQEKPPQSGLVQQVQRPPYSPQKPAVMCNPNGAIPQGQGPSPVQQPVMGMPNKLSTRPTSAISQYSQWPSPMTTPASVVQSQVSSPAASVASLYQAPTPTSASGFSSFQSILGSAQSSPVIPGQTPTQYQHTGAPTKPPFSHAHTAPQASFSPQHPNTVHRPPGNHQVGGKPHGPGSGIPLGPSGPSSHYSPIQQMMHKPPHGTQIPPATPLSGIPNLVPPKPQQLPGSSHVGQATSQMPTQHPVQQQQHQAQHPQPQPQQQPAPANLSQPGNIQSQWNAHTHSPQGQATHSPHSTQPLHAQQPSHSHTLPTAGHQSIHSPVNASQSQQAQVPYPTQSPSNANPAASLSNIGQDMKKWAKKMWKSPAFQQTTAVIGGALMAESMGGDGVAGAMAASQIYNTSQAQQQGQQQGQQPPRPQRPPHVHAQTAPAQSQGLPGPRPNMQPVQQPVSNFQSGGGQAPGRPYAVQNPSMHGLPMQMQQRPPAQAPMMSPPPSQGQQGQYMVNQSPPQTQGQYFAGQQPQYIPPPEQTIMNQQQTINQNFTLNSESNANAGTGPSMAAYSQQPTVVENNQIIIENNSAASGSYFTQPPTAAVPATGTEVNITNINIENNVNNAQYAQFDSSTTYNDSSTMSTTSMDVHGISNNMAATDYSTTTTDYNVVATDYNSSAAFNVDVQMQTMYTAADDVSILYSTETLDASETAGHGDGWAAAAAVTVDYSGGDWGDDWY